ncbi:MAG: DUF2130 domain-containing protein [Sphaerochaetaceae bacterium]|nr:DUF2130 domain-containing protein [Sphaerochaetaceae bacterium]
MDFFKNVSLSKNDANHLVLRINEDVKAGTLIDLNAITDIDTSFIGNLNSLIDQKKDAVYNEKIKIEREEIKRKYEEYIAKVKQQEMDNYQKELNAKILENKLKSEKEASDIKRSYERNVQDLNNRIANADLLKNNEILEIKNKHKEEIAKKDSEINLLNNRLSQVNSEKEKELLQHDLDNKSIIDEIKGEYDKQLKEKDNVISQKTGEIEQLKNYRLTLSTKGVGEDLEQWCYNEFNKHRSMGFQNAEFSKDNDINNEGATKGDFVYRDKDEFGEECISIMFEMKNQTETSGKKHKNEDFYAKLNKDRNNKNCEYAVLVSMLEPENEYFNVGIQDVSYMYPKMYVIRPQFLMPLISILKNESVKGASNRRALAEERQKNIDITKFEEKINTFKTGFTKHYEKAGKRFTDAIADLDKAIKKLTDTKEALLSSRDALEDANDDLDSLTIKKLTYGNKTMKELFASANKNQDTNNE